MLNKIDMDAAMVDVVSDQIVDLIGCDREDILLCSAKTGEGVPAILDAVVERFPAPKGDPEAPLQALIFDSVFNPFRGVIAYFKVVNGVIRKGDKVKFFNTGKEYEADEVGYLRLRMCPTDEVTTGNVGYIISGIKTAVEVKVGDTITHVDRPCSESIAGFEEVKPMLFAGVYPVETDEYENLRASLEKLQLNDASLVFEPESSLALGFGFRCGFLGLLHLEIMQERLYREFDMAHRLYRGTLYPGPDHIQERVFRPDHETLPGQARGAQGTALPHRRPRGADLRHAPCRDSL